MPVEDGVGYGRWTRLKLEHLRAIMAMHVRVTKAVLDRNPYYRRTYHFIDATAGRGKYQFYGEEAQGSPLLFLSVAEDHQLLYRADLIEQKSANASLLREQVPELRSGSAKIHCCEYGLMIRELLPSRDKAQLGLFFVDPSTGIPDFDTVAYVSRVRPRMEVLMYLSATNLKRMNQRTPRLLSDHIAGIGKKHWLVRRPFQSDAHHWTFLLGSNADLFREYKKIDFYPMGSKEAQAFFPKLNFTVRQRFERLQHRLFDL
jgi:three-Cys-motif partner protein